MTRHVTCAATKTGKKVAICVQYGALIYRVDSGGLLEILLVTTRRSHKWIIPKGWPIKGLTSRETAAREAYEEAGARGEVKRRLSATYIYDKFLDDRGIVVPCEVKVFPILVRRMEKVWPEQQQRVVRWFAPLEAEEAVAEVGLKKVIAILAPKLAAVRK